MKILASDYDGTLFANGDNLEANLERIKRFRQLGNIFILATGRDYPSIRGEIDKYKIEFDYLIVNNGASLIDRNEKIILNFSIDNKIKEELRLKLHLSDDCYASKLLSGNVGVRADDVDKINIRCANVEDKMILFSQIEKLYGNLINCYPVNNSTSIDIIAKQTSKCNAILEVARLNNVSKANIYSVGDGLNDLEMLQKFNGACMLTADKTLQKLITKKCKNVASLIDEILA